MALTILNSSLFSGQNGSYTSAAIDVQGLAAFALLLTWTEGGSATAKLTASVSSTGTFVDVADSSQSMGTGAGGCGWDITTQFPFYKIVITGVSAEGSAGSIVAKE